MKRILTLLALIALAACQNAPVTFVAAPLTFPPAMRINVAEIKVIDDYHPPMQAPNVEHEFPIPPAVAVKQWAAARLQAVGSTGVLEITIDDGAVKAVSLPKTGGVKGLFTNDQDIRYDARMHATFKLYNAGQIISVANGDVEVLRSQSVAENATIDARTRVFDRITRDMMAKFDEQAVARLHQYFAAYLR